MTEGSKNYLVLAALFIAVLVFGIPSAWTQDQTMPSAPKPTVPEFFTITGQFTRIAYNNEGFATLGYRTTQQSIGGDWMLLDVGFTLIEGTKDYVLKREHIKLKTPDGTSIPLATRAEFNQAGDHESGRNLMSDAG